MGKTKGIYLLFFAIITSALVAIALEQVSESKGSFDVSVGEFGMRLTPNNTQQEFCGNDIKEGTEQCDGTDLGGATCSSVLGSNFEGSLSCQPEPNCIYNTTSCSAKPPTDTGVGAGGGGGGGGGATAAETVTVTDREADPPSPVQVNV